MRVAIIGRAVIGQTLAAALARGGHDVVFGVRADAEEANELPIAEALQGADAVILAIPGGAVEDFARANADALADHLVIDAANNVGAPTLSSADAIRAAAPSVRYARAFNTLGWENFENPHFGAETADLFFAAPEADREVVEELIGSVGLRPVYLGGDDAVATVDSLVGLWFRLMQQRGNRNIAFRMLER